jgi:hypothetical protein
MIIYILFIFLHNLSESYQISGIFFDITGNIQFWLSVLITVYISLIFFIAARRIEILFSDNIINNLRHHKYEDDYSKKVYLKKLSEMQKYTRSLAKFKKMLNETDNYEPDNLEDKKLKDMVDTFKSERHKKKLTAINVNTYKKNQLESNNYVNNYKDDDNKYNDNEIVINSVRKINNGDVNQVHIKQSKRDNNYDINLRPRLYSENLQDFRAPQESDDSFDRVMVNDKYSNNNFNSNALYHKKVKTLVEKLNKRRTIEYDEENDNKNNKHVYKDNNKADIEQFIKDENVNYIEDFGDAVSDSKFIIEPMSNNNVTMQRINRNKNKIIENINDQMESNDTNIIPPDRNPLIHDYPLEISEMFESEEFDQNNNKRNI